MERSFSLRLQNELTNFVSIAISDFLSPEMCVVEARHSDSPRKRLWSKKAFYQRQGADTVALWPVTEMKGSSVA